MPRAGEKHLLSAVAAGSSGVSRPASPTPAPAPPRAAGPGDVELDVELAPLGAMPPVVRWTTEMVGRWAREQDGIGEQVAAALERQDIDGDMLLEYTRAKAELRTDLGLSVAWRTNKLYRAIQQVTESDGRTGGGGRMALLRRSGDERDERRRSGDDRGERRCCGGFGLPGFRELVSSSSPSSQRSHSTRS